MTAKSQSEAEIRRARLSSGERAAIGTTEAQLRLLLDVNLIGVCTCDLSGRVLEANDPFLRMLGSTREQVRARSIDLLELALPSRREEARRAQKRILEEGALPPSETELLRPDGKIVPVLLAGARLPSRSSVVIFAQDLTETRRKEAAIADAGARLSLLLEAMPVMLLEFDGAGAVTFVEGAEKLGLTPELGQPLLGGPAGQATLATLARRALAGEALRGRVELQQRLFDVTLQPQRANVEGAVTSVLGAAVEVTENVRADARLLEERRRLQEWLAQEQQLEGLGVLAAGLAHAFNNLLAGMLANASSALQSLPPGADAGALEDLVTSASRAAALARQLLQNSVPEPVEAPPLDLSVRLREMAPLLSAVLPHHARLELALAEALPPVSIHPAQLRRALLPLLSGAIEATRQGGGLIRIATRLVELAGGEQALVGGDRLEAGWYVGVQVYDDGPELGAAALAQLDDPLQQPHLGPPGTAMQGARALGLAAVLGSMRARRGGVQVKSAEGAGTSVELLYPVSSAPPLLRPLHEPAGPAALREVLLVDDDPIILRAAARILRPLGLTVRQAASGDEALAQLREGRIRPGLVLLDFAMPGMNGGQTLRALKELQPDLRVLLCSGYSQEEVGCSIDPALLSGYLPKPFTAAALQAAVRRALDGSGLAAFAPPGS